MAYSSRKVGTLTIAAPGSSTLRWLNQSRERNGTHIQVVNSNGGGDVFTSVVTGTNGVAGTNETTLSQTLTGDCIHASIAKLQHMSVTVTTSLTGSGTFDVYATD